MAASHVLFLFRPPDLSLWINGGAGALHETANSERSEDATPTGLPESAGLPKEIAMKKGSQPKKALKLEKQTLKKLTVKTGVRAGNCIMTCAPRVSDP